MVDDVHEEEENMEDYGGALPAAKQPADENEAMSAGASKRSWSQAQRATQAYMPCQSSSGFPSKCVIVTDSEGGYDAVTKSGMPMIGLSTANNALQVYNQLREQLEESFCRLIWISGGCNLSDALTKKARVAREGLIQLFKKNIRKLQFDPTFMRS